MERLCTRELLGMDEALYTYLHFISSLVCVPFGTLSLHLKLPPAHMHFKNVANAKLKELCS